MKKIKTQAGVTVVEMLAAVAVMVFLSMMVGTGMNMAMHAYDTVVAQSEVELLLSTAIDALADDLRYAWNVVDETAPDWTAYGYTGVTGFKYSSDSYGNEIRLYRDDKGRIAAWTGNSDDPQQVLANSDGAYGSNTSYKEYSVEGMLIKHNTDNTFTIHLKVTDGDGNTVSTPGSEWDDDGEFIENLDSGVTIRCLNPQPTPTPIPGGGT